MINLLPALRFNGPLHYVFRNEQHAFRIIKPRNPGPQHPPVQEFVTATFLKADRYQISWRAACSDATRVFRCEIAIFLNNYFEPSMVYDLKNYSEYSVAFETRESRYVYVMLRVQSHAPITLQALHLFVARECLLGRDPLMKSWDLRKVAPALKKQRELVRTLHQLSSIFEWDAVRAAVQSLKAAWQKNFDAVDEQKYLCTTLSCRFQSPVLLATSRDALIGEFHFSTEGPTECALRIGQQHLEPTCTHAQYWIWCFPDKEIKISLRRDCAMQPSVVRFALAANKQPTTPAWFWLGYNMVLNNPFYNFFCIEPQMLEFVNAMDLVNIAEHIEETFQEKNITGEANLYSVAP